MNAYIVYADAITCLGHGGRLWSNLNRGKCGLSPAHSVFPEWFPDQPSQIGAIPDLTLESSRLGQILKLIGTFAIPELAGHCELILGASSLGDLEGEYAGDPYGCIGSYLLEHKPELAPKYNSVVSSACSSGTDVLALASVLVSHKEYDIVGAMAVDCIDRGKLLQHFALGTQSMDKAKPFDVSRSGTSFGEGGGFVVIANSAGLEKLQAVIGGHIYKILGFGMSCDAKHVTAPDETGNIPSLAISRAIGAAKISPERIGYVNAHGSGTTLNDKVESIALRKAFGKALDRTVINGTKGAIGHLLGATGLVEAVMTCWALRDQIVPGTVGLSDIDDGLQLPVSPAGHTRHIGSAIGMSTTFGFGGVNSAIVIESRNN